MFKGILNPEDKTTDAKLFAFIAVVCSTIYWLTWELHRQAKISDEWVRALYGLLATVGLGGTAWAAVDKWRSGNATQPPPAPGAQDKGEGQ